MIIWPEKKIGKFGSFALIPVSKIKEHHLQSSNNGKLASDLHTQPKFE